MTTMRAKRTARIPSHPHEPKLGDILNLMRNRDIFELLKTKRRGELDQMLEGLNTAVRAENINKYNQFEVGFSVDGIDEAKGDYVEKKDTNSSSQISRSSSSDHGQQAQKGNITDENLYSSDYDAEDKISRRSVNSALSADKNPDDAARKARLGLITDYDNEFMKVDNAERKISLAVSRNENDGRSIMIRDTNSFVQLSKSSPRPIPEDSDFSDDTSYKAASLKRTGFESVRASWRIPSSRNSSLTSKGSRRFSTRNLDSDGMENVISDIEDTDNDELHSKSSLPKITGFFSYEILKTRPHQSDYRYPKGVDIDNREQYLSEAEFENIFKMNKASFNKLTKWRKQELKKRYNLF